MKSRAKNQKPSFEKLDEDPYDNIFAKIISDHKDYEDNLKSIDEEIESLNIKRNQLIKDNQKVVALYRATQQFNLKHIVFEQILEHNIFKSYLTIEKQLLETLNIRTLKGVIHQELQEILSLPGVESNNIGYRLSFDDIPEEEED